MNKQHTFVLLPTDKGSNLIMNLYNQIAYSPKPITCEGAQHLYILSDDEIKEGDWGYLRRDKGWVNGNIKQNNGQLGSNKFIIDNCKKITATTNTELWDIKQIDKQNYGVPSISQSDIEYICELYNGKGKEVDVQKLAESPYPMNMIGGGISKSDRQLQQNAFKVGYKKCLQNNADKKFTLEDMKKVMSELVDYYCGDENISPEKAIENIIKSLTKDQPKRDVITVYYETTTHRGWYLDPSKHKPKLKDGCICIVRD